MIMRPTEVSCMVVVLVLGCQSSGGHRLPNGHVAVADYLLEKFSHLNKHSIPAGVMTADYVEYVRRTHHESVPIIPLDHYEHKGFIIITLTINDDCKPDNIANMSNCVIINGRTREYAFFLLSKS